MRFAAPYPLTIGVFIAQPAPPNALYIKSVPHRKLKFYHYIYLIRTVVNATHLIYYTLIELK
jgi:hypothetical protein